MIYAFQASKDPTARRFLEIRDDIHSSPTYMAETLRENIIWPDCCCLCCGPAEEYVDLEAESKIMEYELQIQAKGIPYCHECRMKINKISPREKPGCRTRSISSHLHLQK